MQCGDVARWFEQAVIRHRQTLDNRIKSEMEFARARAERAVTLEPVVQAIAEGMLELATIPEYRLMIGSIVDTLCSGACPKGVPVEYEQTPRADAWLMTFNQADVSLDYKSMPRISVIVGVAAENGLVHIWVNTTRAEALAAARWSGQSIPYMFQEGTLVAHSPEDARAQVVAHLAETVAHDFVHWQTDEKV